MDIRNVVDLQQYRERRQAQIALSATELNSDERDFRGKLRLSKEDAEMTIYCMRLGREYFMVEEENNITHEVEQIQNDLDMVNQLLDMIQCEVLKLRSEEGYIINLNLSELAFIVQCVEMTRNAVGEGINVFQSEAGNKEDYMKWLDGTFFYLLDVYEKWQFYQNI